MAALTSVALGPIPGIEVRVAGDAAAARHFAAEWADAARPGETAPEAPSGRLEVGFVDHLPGATVDGHKSVHWAAALDQPAEHELRLRIALRGWPRWFGLSLVQGYLVEPALSLLAPDVGGVLLPAAAIVRDGRAVVLLGRSGTGKSSLSLRAMAAGLPVLGDDQVFVSSDGRARRFPRRLRIYSDARRTAPEAIGRLPLRYRADLAVRGIVRGVSRGFVAPSLAVPAAALESSGPPASVSIGSVVLMERIAGSERISVAAASADAAVATAEDVLAAQRRRLARVLDPGWAPRIEAVAERERSLLAGSLASAEIVSVSIPDAHDPGGAEAAITALAAALGLP